MNGIIIINKPKNYTSHDVVAKVKKILKCSKVGHTGTLDPNATGVLPLLINDGTKISKYLIEHDKQYEVVLKLGVKTDTADIDGNIINTDKNFKIENINEEKIKEKIKQLEGKQKQVPPIYSAIKVNGKKLYEYAREGKIVELQEREIEIYEIDIIKIDNKNNEIQFKVSCSKGTYIRTLCEDIAKKLNTIGYMKELNRTKVGKFEINKSITIEELENNKDNINYLKQKIINIEEIFKENEKLIIEEKRLNHFLNGVKITYKKPNGIYNIYNEQNKYLGLGIIKENLLKRDVIIVE